MIFLIAVIAMIVGAICFMLGAVLAQGKHEDEVRQLAMEIDKLGELAENAKCESQKYKLSK